MAIGFGYTKKIGDSSHSRFIIDGKPFAEADGDLFEVKDKTLARVRTPRLFAAIAPKSLMELPRFICEWTFHLESPFPEMRLCYEIKRLRNADRVDTAKLEMSFASNDWRYPWSVADYCRLFQKHANEVIGLSGKCQHHADLAIHTLIIPLNEPDMVMSIGAELGRRSWAVSEIHRMIRKRLIIELNPESLVTFFDFPPEHSAACKQYLAYFTNFLHSLGVEADSAVTEEARKVLFTVTPADGRQSLEQIQKALAVFLQLPNGDVSTDDQTSVDPDVQKLAKAIRHLQSMVGGASPVAGSISGCGSGGEVTDKESFFGGRLVIKPLAKGPIELNLPKLIRDLKRFFPALKELE